MTQPNPPATVETMTPEEEADAHLARTYGICTTHEWRAALIETIRTRDTAIAEKARNAGLGDAALVAQDSATAYEAAHRIAALITPPAAQGSAEKGEGEA